MNLNNNVEPLTSGMRAKLNPRERVLRKQRATRYQMMLNQFINEPAVPLVGARPTDTVDRETRQHNIPRTV